MNFHVVTGLPRSGSTLLCNILNQNPDFYASSTSPLPFLLSGLVHAWSNSVEVKGLLEVHREETETRIQACAQGLLYNWYECKTVKTVFDKSRMWSGNLLMLQKVIPSAKMIVCVRNLVDTFASVEKQHTKNPLLDEAENVNDKSIFNRADKMFGPDGLIGTPIIGIEDLIRRDSSGVIFVQYETFTRQPDMVMERIYAELGETPFKHDFDNVVNTSEDPDGLYLYKFPHEGSGKVAPHDPNEWKKYISPDLKDTITNRFPDYNKFFNYTS